MSPLIMSPRAWKHDIVPHGAEGANSLPPCASQTQDQGSSTMVVHHLTVPPSSWSPVTNSRRSASPSSSGSICGKRSRSNSSSSSTSASTSDSGSSIFSNSVNNFVGSPATSLSGASDSDEEQERMCHSPSAGKRKALRRAWRNDACTAASATRPRASKTAKKPSVSSAGSGDDSDSALSLTSATSSPRSDEDVRGLDGAVQAFGLSSREHTPESSQPGVISTKPATTAPSKSSLVDHLVDAAVATIDAIWHSPLSTSKQADMPPCTASGLPLSTFIRETLRRSRTSCSTLQAALLYCLRCAPAVRKQRMAFESLPKAERDGAAAQILSERAGLYSPLLCGRRIFLASVMVASKFLQDKNFSNKAWSSLTGLPLKQLGLVEREFLAAIGWDLNVKQDEWTRWCHKLTEAKLQKSEGCQGNIRASHALTAPSPSPSSVHTSLQHKALAIVKAAAIDDRQDRSGSSTPTPAALRPRGNLSRIHSDDGPLKAFDTALTPTAVGQYPQRPMSMGATHAKAVRDLTPPVTVPQPYPMPRAFVRSAHSFSSGGDRLSALQTPQGLLAGGDAERQ